MRNPLTLLRVILFFVICLGSAGYSQKQGQDRVDSLLTRLSRFKREDTATVNLYYAISFGYYGIDPVKGITYGKEGVDLAGRLNYQTGLVLCLISTGICYWASADYPKSLDFTLRALQISEKNGYKNGIAKSSGNLGNIYAENEDYPKALEYYNKALKISEELKDELGIARNLGNIGTVYREQKDYEKALAAFFDALKHYETVGEKRFIAVTLANIGRDYSEQSKYELALKYLNDALRKAEETGETRWIMYDYGYIGEVYYYMATDTTAAYRAKLHSLSKQVKEGYLKLSLGYLERAAEYAKKPVVGKQLILWYQDLSNTCQHLENWKDAFKYADSSHRLKDSIFAEESKFKLANLGTKRDNEVQEKEIQLQNARLEKATIQSVAMAGGLLALIIIILIIYKSRRRSERLLLHLLPATIARRLKKREKLIADKFDNAAVVFIDIVGFSVFSKDKDPQYLVEVLTDFFSRLDALCDKYGTDRIKTIGDGYLAVCGLPDPPDSVLCAARFAIASREMMRNYKTRDGREIHVRIGIDAGEVIAGVIGEKRFNYDLWGDTVNTALQMESLGIEGEIQVTANVVDKLEGKFSFTERGEIEVKSRGKMKTWLLKQPL